MIVVGHTHRHNDVTGPDVEMLVERFLHPELLQGHLAATLSLLLELACLFGFLLGSSFYSTMFKFDFSSYRPSVAKVVAKHYHCMRNVYTPKAGIILITIGMAITEHIVTIEMVTIDRLSIATNCES